MLVKDYLNDNIKALWGPIDPMCSNCIGRGRAQYLVSYVQTT